MGTPILSDESHIPTAKIIFSHLGKSKPLWLALFQFIADAHPDFTQEWRYYRDGKRWLMKVQHKKKTVEDSTISEKLKNQYRNARSFGKLRGISVVYRNQNDVEFAKELIGIKMSIK
jgi:hypothetical protein